MANSRHVTGIISLVAFSFMVQEPKRDHRLIERQILALEMTEIAQHFRFRVIQRKHRMGEEGSLALQGRRNDL